MDLYLHIGAGKCGSTSIQNFLGQNETTLAGQGFGQLDAFGKGQALGLAAIVNPEHGRTRWGRRIEHQTGLSYEAFAEGFWTSAAAEIATSDCHSIVASSEFIYGICGRDEERIRALRDRLHDLFDTVTILFYCRDQVSWLKSRHAQMVKGSAKSRESYADVIATMERFDPVIDFHGTLCIWADIFGDDTLRVGAVGSPSLHGNNLVLDFIDKLGIPESDQTAFSLRQDRANISPSYSVLDLHRRLNALRQKGLVPKRAYEAALKILKSRHIAARGKGYPADHDALIRERYADSNRRFEKRFGIAI